MTKTGSVDAFAISEAQVEEYYRDGFLAVPPVLGSIARRELRRALQKCLQSGHDDRMAANQDGPPALIQAVNTWSDSKVIRRYVFDSHLAEAARVLSRANVVRLWHDQLLLKPAKGGAATPWHQDFMYWPMYEPRAISLWISLDEVNETNGCMRYVPGSHNWGLLPLFGQYDLDVWYGAADLIGSAKEPVAVPLDPGACVFHHGLVLHGAYGNHGTKSRLALKVIYLPDVIRYRTNHHIVSDSLNLPDGAPLAGPSFPVLSPAPEID